MAISKIIYKTSAQDTGTVWMDATPATAVAADITAPKTAMLADGVVTTGTGSGGQSGTWQIVHQGTYTITDDGDTGYIATSLTPFDSIESGTIWRVTWNNTVYTMTATEAANVISPDFAVGYGVGNLSAFGGTTGNNEPFAMACFNFWGDYTLTFLTLADSGTVSLMVEKFVPTPSGSSWTLLDSQELTVSTSSTTATDISDSTMTIQRSDHYTKILYIQVRDKAGPRNGYFYGTDTYWMQPIGGSQMNAYRMQFTFITDSNSVKSSATSAYGVYPKSPPTFGNDTVAIDFASRYSSAYSSTVDGTYVVKVYDLTYPDNDSPFDD